MPKTAILVAVSLFIRALIGTADPTEHKKNAH
jgi:hypothetical protein